MKKYKILKIEEEKLNSYILGSFDNLPKDEFLKKDEDFIYRYRRYGSGIVSGSIVKWDSNDNNFLQSTELNHYVGGVARKFEFIEHTAQIFIANVLVRNILGKFIPEGKYSLGAHQIRIRANNYHMGKPAPEGIHQDGFDYVAVSCINMYNITGGTSILVDATNYKTVLLEKNLTRGEVLIFDDKRYAHYASPIVPKIPGECFRDVIVTTYKKID